MRATLKQFAQKTHSLVSPVWVWISNGLFPPRCMACRATVDTAHRFCDRCFSTLSFIAAPQCECCGMPFEMALGEQALCAACIQQHPPYDRARAALHYDEQVRPMITQLKYHDRTHHAGAFARLMWRAGAVLLVPDAVLVPVPLHPRRLLQRKFNQSALLAEALADLSGCQVVPDALLRVRHTPPQARLSRKERLENVKGAFRVNHRHAMALRSKKIVLVDDVMTTGATIHACVEALRAGNVARVDVLTLARTIKGE